MKKSYRSIATAGGIALTVLGSACATPAVPVASTASPVATRQLTGTQRLSLITVYFNEPDHTGHDLGPDSPKIAPAAARADNALGRLVNGLRERGVYDKVNLIVASDHGMSQLSPDRVVCFDDAVDTASVRITSLSPDIMVTPRMRQ